MSQILTETLNHYIESSHKARIHSIEGISIIEQPTFAILPNHPYRCPISVAVYCRRGEGKGRVNARTFDIEANTMFIVLPNQITELIDVSDDFDAVYVVMTDSFTESLSIGNTFNMRNIITEQPYTKLGAQAREALEGYLSMCINIIKTKSNPHREEIIRLLTRAFFLGLGYFIHEEETPSVADNRATALTSDFIALVESNYRQHRDLAFYAERMGLTPKYVSTVVKESSGKSATEWIEKYVTLDAITQLTSTDRTIKQIAYDLNFPSQSFFGKYFTRVVGISPAAYRENYRQSGPR